MDEEQITNENTNHEDDYGRDLYDSIDWEKLEHRRWRRQWEDEHPFNQHDFL